MKEQTISLILIVMIVCLIMIFVKIGLVSAKSLVTIEKEFMKFTKEVDYNF